MCVSNIIAADKLDEASGTISTFDCGTLTRLRDKNIIYDYLEEENRLSFKFANGEVRDFMTI